MTDPHQSRLREGPCGFADLVQLAAWAAGALLLGGLLLPMGRELRCPG